MNIYSTNAPSRAKQAADSVRTVFRWAPSLAPVVLLVVHFIMLGAAAYLHSPTFNEPGHLVAGIENWYTGRVDLYRVNPPLVRLVAAIPVLLSDPEVNWNTVHPGTRAEFALGERFVAANGYRSFWLFTLARWACIPFSLLGGMICYIWARDLYGTRAAILALTLWCFCPNILGHGQLITPDIGATSLGLAATYTFWRWLRNPTWTEALVSGFVLGLAELAKMTLIVLFVVWPVVWLLYRWPDRKSLGKCDWLRELGMLALRGLIAFYILNCGYGFEGTFTRLGDYTFNSQMFCANQNEQQSAQAGGNRFIGTWLEGVRVPLPKSYLLGIDLQKQDFEEYSQPSYLRGQFSPKGWWYYYLYAIAIKVPVGTWLLVFVASLASLFSPPIAQLRDEFVLLCPAAVILAFVSSQTGFSEHMRYVLPAFPFVFIWIGRLATVFDGRHWIVARIATAALAWSITSSLWFYPNGLSYFNELVGGPKGGPKHLIQSNVDWGQDLLKLKEWLDEHPEARPIRLAYFGYFDPIHADIEYAAPSAIRAGQVVPPGWYAISVNFVRGLPFFVHRGNGSKGRLNQDALSAFQELEPVAMAGYSIYIYHVQESPVEK